MMGLIVPLALASAHHHMVVISACNPVSCRPIVDQSLELGPKSAGAGEAQCGTFGKEGRAFL